MGRREAGGGFHKGESERESEGRALKFKPCRAKADWLKGAEHKAHWTRVTLPVLRLIVDLLL